MIASQCPVIVIQVMVAVVAALAGLASAQYDTEQVIYKAVNDYKAADQYKMAEQQYKPADEYKMAEQQYKAADQYKMAEQQYKPAAEYKVVEQQYKPAAEYKMAEQQYKPASEYKMGDEYKGNEHYGKESAYTEEKHYPHQPYGFGYNIDDGYGNKQWRHEKSSHPHQVTGSYGYKDKNGIMREVEYVADKHGFRAMLKTTEPGTASNSPAYVKVSAHPVMVDYQPPAKQYKQPKQQSHQQDYHGQSQYAQAAAPQYQIPANYAAAMFVSKKQEVKYEDPAAYGKNVAAPTTASAGGEGYTGSEYTGSTAGGNLAKYQDK